MTTPTRITETRREGQPRRRPLRCLSDIHLRAAIADLEGRPTTADQQRSLGLAYAELDLRARAS